MELFGVGIGEAGLVLLIALLVVGPERFPQIAREGGKWYRMARQFTASVTQDLQGALKELENEVQEQAGELKTVREIGDDVRTGMRETSSDLNSIGRGVATSTTTYSEEQRAVTETRAGVGADASAMPVENPQPWMPEPITTPQKSGPPTPEAIASVMRAYSEYHQPRAAEPPAPTAPPSTATTSPVPPTQEPEQDPDEMARHAVESFEGYRTGEEAAPASSAPPATVMAVNPFPGSPPPAAPPSASDAQNGASGSEGKPAPDQPLSEEEEEFERARAAFKPPAANS
jgi:sec-independent protein translocase protein TatB